MAESHCVSWQEFLVPWLPRAVLVLEVGLCRTNSDLYKVSGQPFCYQVK